MKNKYEILPNDSLTFGNITVYRIRALKDFTSFYPVGEEAIVLPMALKRLPATITEGTLGGYVESEENLSQEGGCWIWDNTQYNPYYYNMAFGSSRISGDAILFNQSQLFGKAEITDNATIIKSQIGGDAKFDKNSIAYGAKNEGTLIVTDNGTIASSVSSNSYVKILAKGFLELDIQGGLVETTKNSWLEQFPKKIVN